MHDCAPHFSAATSPAQRLTFAPPSTRQERKRGKKKALSVLEAKIGRTVYHLCRKQRPFDAKRFFSS
jgi:hypothetical protein